MAMRQVLAMIALGAATLSGCAEAPDFSGLPEQQQAKAVHVIERDQTLVLDIDARTGAPTAAARAQLGAALAGETDRASLRVTLRGPQPRAILEHLAAAFTAAGIARAQIVLAPASAPVEGAPGRDHVAVDIADYRLVVPSCPDWSRPDALGNANPVASNFGCATAANFAAMLAEPGDLAAGRGSAVTDGGNAADAVAAWRAGKLPDLPSDKDPPPLITLEGNR